MPYTAHPDRYERMTYRRCGKSGIKLPVLTLGLWHNFGGVDNFETGREIIHKSFDAGITHFDLANNYGPPPGSAEEFFGAVLQKDLKPYRDELLISTKAGYGMWPGPYGDWGSKKYLISSLDQSLKRMGLDYVDIFYSHRPDPETPIEETMEALAQAVRQGKALYVGLSNYNSEQTRAATDELSQMGVRCLIHQPRYSMFDRWTEEDGLYDTLEEREMGSIVFSPLEQGLLTDRYLKDIPEDSRANKSHGFLNLNQITEEKIEKVRKLKQIAENRGQSVAQLALVWVLRDRVTSALIGVSRVSQLEDNLKILDNLELTESETQSIEAILNS